MSRLRNSEGSETEENSETAESEKSPETASNHRRQISEAELNKMEIHFKRRKLLVCSWSRMYLKLTKKLTGSQLLIWIGIKFRYYFAVVVRDSVAAADYIYRTCDGIELKGHQICWI
ncbi:unnamed protein product [Lactuca virosa]|uniref:ESF1 RRM domain-containing protein n=1 Tax=Lactuca virosa TaxID=75947 RepID=A0AAU9MKS7_9ASTR|nr:unnamed protein product [Lactuca virosa]